jgi:chromate transporter
LKLVAAAIVAQAVAGMAQTLCPDRPRATIALVSLFLMAVGPAAWSQIAVIALGAVAGYIFCQRRADAARREIEIPITARMGALFAALFVVLLGLSFLPAQSGALALAGAFYRSGALVFGGGHVVLPLLNSAVVAPGWISDSAFLSGYGAAQAMPGPLFTFAAYLGAAASAPPGGIVGAALALVSIFLPGLLLLMAVTPFWSSLSARPGARASMAGVNAAVVGLLASALYDPVWTSAVKAPIDFAIVAAGFIALAVFRAPPLVAVILCGIAGMLGG